MPAGFLNGVETNRFNNSILRGSSISGIKAIVSLRKYNI
jgi:hypothetical protein